MTAEPLDNEWQRITTAERQGMLGYIPCRSEPDRVANIPDLHVPYHDVSLVAEAMARVREFKPTHINFIGDCVDAYTVSSFDKDPRRRFTLQDEIDTFVREVLEPVRAQNQSAQITIILGNHEERLDRYIMSRAPGLAGMRALSWHELYRSRELDIAVLPSSGFRKWGMRLKHGDAVASKAGVTAGREMEAHRCSGRSGHTHRFGEAQRVDKEGLGTRWREIGHLCDVSKADYVANPDWQAGMDFFIAHADGEIEEMPLRLH